MVARVALPPTVPPPTKQLKRGLVLLHKYWNNKYSIKLNRKIEFGNIQCLQNSYTGKTQSYQRFVMPKSCSLSEDFSQLGRGIEPTTLATGLTPRNKSDHFEWQLTTYIIISSEDTLCAPATATLPALHCEPGEVCSNTDRGCSSRGPKQTTACIAVYRPVCLTSGLTVNFCSAREEEIQCQVSPDPRDLCQLLCNII